MSLIHDALKSMDAAAPQAAAPAVAARAPAPAPSASPAARGGRPAWVDGVLAFAVVVGVGGAGWVYWQSQKSPKAPALLPAAIVVPQPVAKIAPAPEVYPESAQVLAAPLVETPVVMAPESAPVLSASVVRVESASASPTPVAARTAPVARPQAVVRSARKATALVEVPVATPAVAETPIELHFARFMAAMKEGHTVDAERELRALKARLPAGSLGLMRAQAWFDLRAGNDVAAAEQYRAILERMAGDEEAAINLASILARQGKPEEARATLDSAVRLQPDSAGLRSALAQFTPNARQ